MLNAQISFSFSTLNGSSQINRAIKKQKQQQYETKERDRKPKETFVRTMSCCLALYTPSMLPVIVT